MAKCRFYYNCANNTLCKDCKEYDPKGNYDGHDEVTVGMWLCSRAIWAIKCLVSLMILGLVVGGVIHEIIHLIAKFF